jgi:cytochrome c
VIESGTLLPMILTLLAGMAALVFTTVQPASTEASQPAEAAKEEAKAEQGFKVLVFSKTAGFRHDSIPEGIEAIRKLGEKHGFSVEATEGFGVFHGRAA